MQPGSVPERRLRASDAERDQALTVLQRGYEEGRLDLDELRERQEKALKAKFIDELPRLLADLPESGVLSPAARDVAPSSYAALPATGPADGGFSVSIMSGQDVLVESGTRELCNFAWWGGNNYDLRQAMGPGRIVTLTLHAIMGGNNVYIPEGVRVIDRSVAIMAGNEVKSRAQGDGSNGTLVIAGFLWWGGNLVDLHRDDRD